MEDEKLAMAEISEVSTEERLAQLINAKFQIEDMDHKAKAPKIQRVAYFLRQNEEFAKYWSPKLISIGPIHNHLKLGEQYKLIWTAIHVEEYSKQIHQDIQQTAQVLHKRIEDNLKELKKLFTEDAIKGYNDKELAWMLFVDGCSVLQFMEKIDIVHPNALKLKIDQLYHMWKDLLLLENQIPFRVLKLLTKDLSKLEDFKVYFLFMGVNKHEGVHEERRSRCQQIQPIHLLDLNRSLFVTDFSGVPEVKTPMENEQGTHQVLEVWQTYKNIRDLKGAGIRVKAHENWCWSNISFTSNTFSGELKLPPCVFNHVTPYFFWNLIAYEACPDFQNDFECSTYFAFMDSLIDDAEDVKELRLAGVIQNFLGNDEEVANLFNSLGTDLAAKMLNFWSIGSYSRKYVLIKEEIEKHYKNKYKTWMAEFYNTHFNSPWAMMAFLAALLALVLTFIQTWYAIKPNK